VAENFPEMLDALASLSVDEIMPEQRVKLSKWAGGLISQGMKSEPELVIEALKRSLSKAMPTGDEEINVATCENACSKPEECFDVRAWFSCGHYQCRRTTININYCIRCGNMDMVELYPSETQADA
jgi:hypothetical protein